MTSKTDNRPVVSIITVVYNSEQLIEKTIQSVVKQEYALTEYIIVDGGSTDKTVEIISKYKNYIKKWISEKDNGLYDAMNKAIKLASGDYVWFINSGDEIYNSTVLEEIFMTDIQMPDVIYGETEIIDYKGQSLGMRRHSTPEKLTWKSLKWGMKVCHQSVLVKRSIVEDYNLNYKHSSDFEWLIRMLKKSGSVHNSRLILSKFMEGGQTSKNLVPGLKERFKIMVNYYGFISTFFIHIVLVFKLLFYYIRHKRI